MPRLNFDNRLFDRALEAGAQDFTGLKFVGTKVSGQHRVVEVQARDKSREFIASRLLVGADGANSVVRTALKATPSTAKHRGIAMRAYAKSDAFDVGGSEGPRMIFSFTRELLPSYAWLFPTGRGIVNIGVGGPVLEIQKTGQNLRSLIAAFANQIRSQGVALEEPYALQAHHLPHFGEIPNLAYSRAALIGDAASMINPFSGEGISYGMNAAARLVEMLPDNISDPEILDGALVRFQQDFHHTYRAHMASTLFMHRLMRWPYWAKLSIDAAGRDPAVLHDAIDLLFGFGRVRATTSMRILRAWAIR